MKMSILIFTLIFTHIPPWWMDLCMAIFMTRKSDLRGRPCIRDFSVQMLKTFQCQIRLSTRMLWKLALDVVFLEVALIQRHTATRWRYPSSATTQQFHRVCRLTQRKVTLNWDVTWPEPSWITTNWIPWSYLWKRVHQSRHLRKETIRLIANNAHLEEVSMMEGCEKKHLCPKGIIQDSHFTAEWTYLSIYKLVCFILVLEALSVYSLINVWSI